MRNPKHNALIWPLVGVMLPTVALAQLVGAQVVDAESRAGIWSDPLLGSRGVLICHSTAQCPGYDLNCDNFNDGLDVAILCCATNFGLPVEEATCPKGDLDCDGIITGLDVALATSSACTRAHLPLVDGAADAFDEIDVLPIEEWVGDLAPYQPPDGVSERDQLPIDEWEGDVKPYTPPLYAGEREQVPVEEWVGDLAPYQPPDGVSERDQLPIDEWEGDVEPYRPPEGISQWEELPFEEWISPQLYCHSQSKCPAEDVDCDNAVTAWDVLTVCSPKNFGLHVDECACPRADVNCDGMVNGIDVALVASSACMDPLVHTTAPALTMSAATDPDIDDGCDTTAPCPEADVNCDGQVDQADLKLICHPENFGHSAAEAAHPRADCDGDGYVTGLDIAMASSSYCLRGPCDSMAACPGADLDCDHRVTGLDIALMTSSANLGLPVTEAAWPESDLDGDGVITNNDVAIASEKCFGY